MFTQRHAQEPVGGHVELGFMLFEELYTDSYSEFTACSRVRWKPRTNRGRGFKMTEK